MPTLLQRSASPMQPALMCCWGQNMVFHLDRLLDCQNDRPDLGNRMLQNGRHYGCPRSLTMSSESGHEVKPGPRGLTKIIRVPPLEPNLQVVILVHQLQEPLKDRFALQFGQPIDVLNVAADREDTLPPSNRICADDWVDGFELASYIFRRSPWLVI
jgi:hypothetical protein